MDSDELSGAWKYLSAFKASCVVTRPHSEVAIAEHAAEATLLVGRRTDPGCDLATYRLLCTSMNVQPGDSVQLRIGKSTPVDLPLSAPNREKRSVVMCTSRMFAFEAWKLLLVSVELYRALGADLIVAYVESVLDPLLALMQQYEADGMLSIRHSLVMPSVPTMDRDPNSETEWGNQLAVFQECLYEFRESAEFIAFPDWDDLLVTLRHNSIVEAFRLSATMFPSAGAFVVKRTDTTFLGNENAFDMESSLYQLRIPRSPTYMPGKMFVRPARVQSIWIHGPELMEPGYGHAHVSSKHIIALHSRSRVANLTDLPLPPVISITAQLIRNYHSFVQRRNLTNLVSALPSRQIYYDLFAECYKDFSRLFMTTQECITHRYCPKPKLSFFAKHETPSCVNVRNSFEHYTLPKVRTHLFVRTHTALTRRAECEVWKY
ncbi:Protein F59C6.8 [Aphelenchoides avenae]|nr:Protein F59C6.8 [Aphelenchus avenae]